jgi:hypothetical protein
LLDEIECDVADDGEILSIMSGTRTVVVFVKGNVKTQWSWFSIHQWVLTTTANLAASGGREVRQKCV